MTEQPKDHVGLDEPYWMSQVRKEDNPPLTDQDKQFPPGYFAGFAVCFTDGWWE